MSTERTTAPKPLGDFAPKFAELTDSVLFGDVWRRDGLSPRDRSLVTVTAIAALNRPEQLRFHLSKALDNGVTRDELVEAFTHLAFYLGWPLTVNALQVLREVVEGPKA